MAFKTFKIKKKLHKVYLSPEQGIHINPSAVLNSTHHTRFYISFAANYKSKIDVGRLWHIEVKEAVLCNAYPLIFPLTTMFKFHMIDRKKDTFILIIQYCWTSLWLT